MKALKEFIQRFTYDKYEDYLLNYSYEDFLEKPIYVFGNEIIYENVVDNEDTNIYKIMSR